MRQSSSLTRSPATRLIRSLSRPIMASVPASMVNPYSAASRTPRMSRAGSSRKMEGPTARMTLASRSFCPPNGSITRSRESPAASMSWRRRSTAMASMVKSRRARSVSMVPRMVEKSRWRWASDQDHPGYALGFVEEHVVAAERPRPPPGQTRARSRAPPRRCPWSSGPAVCRGGSRRRGRHRRRRRGGVPGSGGEEQRRSAGMANAITGPGLPRARWSTGRPGSRCGRCRARRPGALSRAPAPGPGGRSP